MIKEMEIKAKLTLGRMILGIYCDLSEDSSLAPAL
jgi:hypothetical protein